MLLRSKLSLRQTGMCMVLSFAVTSAVLGAMAPVAIAFDLLVAPRTPAAGHSLLLMHTAMVAVAGTTGVLRLRTLLAKLGLEHTVARRVLVAWLAAQFLVGSQLCWLLRPFFGELGVHPTFVAHGVLRGNFFEAVATLVRSTFGPAAPVVHALALVGLVVTLAMSLDAPPRDVTVEVGPSGLAVTGAMSRVIPWCEIARVTCEGAMVTLHLVPNETLTWDTCRVPCGSKADADALARRIDEERLRVHLGPFRSATSR
jgi:hypothetical protein